MSAHPGVASPRRPIHSAGSVLTLGCLLVLAACDSPQPSEAIAGPQFAPPAPLVAEPCFAFQTGAPTKTGTFTVKLSTNATAAGIVVTMIHPTLGPVCSAVTNADGKVQFANMSRGEQYFVSIRDEVSPYAPVIEIGPADPNDTALDLLEDLNGPSRATRQMPTLLSGNACAKSPLTWSDYSATFNTPCRVPTTGSSSFAVSVTLSPAQTVEINIHDPIGAFSGRVLVAAISTPRSTDAAPCSKVPWVNATEPDRCDDADNDPEDDEFSGPGLLQTMTVTQAGTIALGLARGNPLYIEATGQQSGFTLFGTLIIDPEDSQSMTGGSSYTLRLEPGMCAMTTVQDLSEPSTRHELDILRSTHSIGLATSTGAASGDVPADLGPMELDAVPGTIVVKAVITATDVGGIGEFNLQYRGETGPGNRTLRIPFSLTAVSCEKGTVTGTGLGGDVAVNMYCDRAAGATPQFAEYTIYFTITGLPTPLAGAEYRITAGKDHLDPSRSDVNSGANISRGAIEVLDLNRTTCPVPGNNDGRWLIV